MEPFHEETEDGQENGDGDFIPTFRRGMKRYRIRTGLVPDYMVDAIQRMKLHDHIELTFKTGEIEQIYNVDVEMEWQFEKYCHQATVVLTFDMDEKIVVGSCCDNLTVGDIVEPEPIPEIYWIATNGDDNSGDGAYGNPWKTLAYAATQATLTGDIIHVRAGTYIETTQTVLAPGVSIFGAGDTSIITTATALDPIIAAYSVTQGTDGNQSISYLKFDGDLTALSCIKTKARSNFSLHHCTIVDFVGADPGVVDIDGRYTGSSEPTTYATGCSVHHCTFTNNGYDFLYSADTYFAYGTLGVGGVSGMLIYDNVINNVTGGRYGYGIRSIRGHVRGLKIYNNTISLNFRDSVGYYSYAFAVELWTGHGGVEIYNNTCVDGGIDVSGYGWSDDYAYGYALSVHDNDVQMTSQPATIESGLIFESGFSGGVYVYNNFVKNFQTALVFSLRENSLVQDIDGFYVYYNIFAEIGQNATMTGYGMQYNMVKTSASYTPAINDFRVYNNVFYRAAGTVQIYGINMVAKDSVTGLGADWSNISVKNNIWYNVYTPCKWEDQTVDVVGIDKNISYNATNNNRFVNCVLTNDTLVAMLTGDPTFVSAVDYHLQAGSPCINAGIATGLAFITTDYDDEAIANPPEIGAYEF